MSHPPVRLTLVALAAAALVVGSSVPAHADPVEPDAVARRVVGSAMVATALSWQVVNMATSIAIIALESQGQTPWNTWNVQGVFATLGAAPALALGLNGAGLAMRDRVPHGFVAGLGVAFVEAAGYSAGAALFAAIQGQAHESYCMQLTGWDRRSCRMDQQSDTGTVGGLHLLAAATFGGAGLAILAGRSAVLAHEAAADADGVARVRSRRHPPLEVVPSFSMSGPPEGLGPPAGARFGLVGRF